MQTTDRVFDTAYFSPKMALFERTFDAELIARLTALAGDRFQPETEVLLGDIERDYSYYFKLVVDTPELREFSDRYHRRLQPIFQSPFLLPGMRVSQGPWLGIYKLNHFPLCDITAETVANKRVLDIGCNAGFDTFYLSTLGASEVIGIEPYALFYTQALFFWSLYYCPNLRFLNTRWQDIHVDTFGKFDVVNCQGILYHERSPMQLLERLFALTSPGGKLLLETHVTLDDDDKARFITGTFWGDHEWYWIPSVRTVCAMLTAVGFENVQPRAQHAVPSKNPDDPERTVEGVPVGGRAFITATHPASEGVFRPKYGY